MRKLKLQVQITLDGYMGGPNGEMDWMTLPWDAGLESYVARHRAPVRLRGHRPAPRAEALLTPANRAR